MNRCGLLVYSFHIPFLFYLSGYAAHWSGATAVEGTEYWSLFSRRANRLLLPAMVFGLVILAGKLTLMGVLTVDHAPANFMSGVVDLVWHTDQSPAQSVWYLIVLFVYAAGVPPLLWLLHGRALVLLLLSLPLLLIHFPPILYADRIGLYAPFFLAGVVAAGEDAAWCRWIDAGRRGLGILFLVVLLAELWFGAALPRVFGMVLASLVALPALHAAVRHLPPAMLRLLDSVTPFAFAIYLLNTVFIGLAKALLMKQLPWNSAWFPLFAAVLMTAGVMGPIMTKRLLFRPVPVLDRMTR